MSLDSGFKRRRQTVELSPRVLALRWLARRPLTRAELLGRLTAKGIEADEAAAVAAELLAERLIDDAALAYEYIVLRARRMFHGRTRLLRDLERRGVDAGVAEAAWMRAVELGELDPEELLRKAVTRRLQRERDGSAAVRRRVYNALFRAGFPAMELRAELIRQLSRIEDSEHGNGDYERL